MKIQFSTSNAMFCDPSTGNPTRLSVSMAAADIIREIANELEQGYTERTILDVNGNVIGSWEL